MDRMEARATKERKGLTALRACGGQMGRIHLSNAREVGAMADPDLLDKMADQEAEAGTGAAGAR